MRNKLFLLMLTFFLIFLLVGCENELPHIKGTVGWENTMYYLSDGSKNVCDDAEFCKKCIQAAESYITVHFEKEKTRGTVKFFELEDVVIDEEETARNIERYAGSELAKTREWTTSYLEENFLVVRAEYCVEYDGIKSPDNSGDKLHYMIMTYSVENSSWEWVDSYIR